MEAQTEVQTNAPLCKTQLCKRPLTYLEKQGCWRCFVCNPIPKDAPKPKEQKKFLDVAVQEERVVEMIKEALEKGAITYIAIGKSRRPETMEVEIGEGRIREIVQDELMNWHIQKSPITKDLVEELTSTSPPEELKTSTEVIMADSLTWRQQAKALGISLMKEPKGTGPRKKEDVLADIKVKMST